MKELVEKKNDLITRAEEILGVAKTENRELTADEVTEIEGIRENVRSIEKTLELNDEFSKMERKEIVEEVEKEINERSAEQIAIDERNAFENYVRGFVAKEVNERSGELSPATSPASGGALIPTTIVNYIIRKVYDICPILDRSQKFNVKGKLQVPYYPADGSTTITVAYQTEFEDLTSSSGAFATKELGGFLAGCLTKISRSLINNVEFDIVGFIVDEMAYAIKRFIEHELLIGTTSPSAKVLGLSTLSNGITAEATNAITADEIIMLHDSIKDEFQQNAIWIMSPATRTALRLLKAQTGMYMLNDDISTPFGVSILGKPVYVSDNMPDIGAGRTVIYYGDMRGLGTKFSEQMNIEVLRERFATQHAVGVVGWFEFDAKVINEQQIAKLTMHSA